MLILIIAATDRDKNLLRGGNEQLSCCHCLIQPPRSFRFLSANHAEKLKAQRRVPLNAGDPQEQRWLSQVTNVHRPFDPIVSARVQSDAVCVITALKGGLCVVRPGRPSKIEWWRVMNCVSAPLVCSFWSRFKQFFFVTPRRYYFFFMFECTSLIPTQTCSKHTLCESVCVRKNGAMQSIHEKKKNENC